MDKHSNREVIPAPRKSSLVNGASVNVSTVGRKPSASESQETLQSPSLTTSTSSSSALPSFASLTANLKSFPGTAPSNNYNLSNPIANPPVSIKVQDLAAAAASVSAYSNQQQQQQLSNMQNGGYSVSGSMASPSLQSRSMFPANQQSIAANGYQSVPNIGGGGVRSNLPFPAVNNNMVHHQPIRALMSAAAALPKNFDEHRGSTSSISSGSLPSPYLPLTQSSMPQKILQRMQLTASSPIAPSRHSIAVPIESLNFNSSSQNDAQRRKSDEEKRMMHTLSERQRRKTVNDSFSNLKQVLPDFAEVDKPIKMEILKNAKQYIASLTSETESLEKELRFLLDQAEDLGLDPEEILESIEASERVSATATAATETSKEGGGSVKASSSSHSNGGVSSASDSSSRERGSYSSSGSSLSPVRKMSSPKHMAATSPLSNSHSSGRKRFRDEEESAVGAAALQNFSEASKRRASADVGRGTTGDEEDDDDDGDDDDN